MRACGVRGLVVKVELGGGCWLFQGGGGKHRRATVAMARRLCHRCVVSEVVEGGSLFTAGRGFRVGVEVVVLE